MKTKAFEFIRARFHPLHRLRKSRFFRKCLLPLLDRDVAIRGDFAQKVYVKAVTHSPLYLTPDVLEPRIKSLFLALLKKLPADSLFFDVGANIGLFTWLAAGTSDNLKIIAFEPDPENFRLLTKTAKAWKAHNVQLHQMAVSAAEGMAVFQRDSVTSATGSLEHVESFTEKHFQTTGQNIQVLSTTLDAVAEKEGFPGIIKIDVEGHEAKVFAGAWKTIQTSFPVIFFESFVPNPDFLNKLIGLQYFLFDADHGGLARAQTVNYVAVRSGSPLEAVVREHLAARC